MKLNHEVCLPNQPGTYCLIGQCSTSSSITIGKLGTFQIEPGYYLYVGSALGKGGLNSRLQRHLRKKKRTHWHLDYLRESLTPLEIWYSTETKKREHQWAELCLRDNDSRIPIKKFGASDCDCPAHLFYYELRPKFEQFCQRQAENLLTHNVIKIEVVS